MIKKLIKYLILKIETMTKNKKNEVIKTETIVEKGIVENLETSKTGEVSQTLEEEKAPEEILQDALEKEEIDHEQFSIDMMNAFINSTEKLKGMKKQFNFNAEHFISIQIVENERLLSILETLKPKTDAE